MSTKEINIGDYVRTKDGIKKVSKYTYNEKYENGHCIWFDNKDYGILFTDEEINKMKSSPNIIDLIEAGDYVNGGRVVEHAHEPGRLFVENIYVGGWGQTSIENYSYELTSKEYSDEPDIIETIVTKEQFKSMEYKVGDKE